MGFDPDPILKSLSTHPGVYQMLDEHGTVLYVGKAKNLKKRVSSYFKTANDTKTQVLVSKIADIETTITRSENEALLLESNLIKQLKPRYNILLRDDKSYPYLYLTSHLAYPRIDFYRGKKRGKGRYFGPYPSTAAVRETLALLQKLFRIRQCSDSFFKNRIRPCLQYQIKRCTAPCVKFISQDDYQKSVEHAVLFLEGKNQLIINELIEKMHVASDALEYEKAARLRDQIAKLRTVQTQQFISTTGGNVDVIAAAQGGGALCVQVLFIRGGRLIGSRSHFPNSPALYSLSEALSAFIPQYYYNAVRRDDLPERILVNVALEDGDWLAAGLSELAGKKVTISKQVRGKNRQWVRMAQANAEHALASHNTMKQGYYTRLEALQKNLRLPNMPQRIECFDISHSQGESTVGSCVVYTIDGPKNSDYRRFNVKPTDVTPGDDYGALEHVLTRRYTRLKTDEHDLPDVVMIDGGKGQLRVAVRVFERLQISGVTILSIAKGPGRKPMYDRVFISERDDPIDLQPDAIALHLLQHIRDEAHRFAITAHRKQRGKKKIHSEVADIPGIGAKKRKDLLDHFGGLQELKKASVDEIAKVSGIGVKTAQVIYDALH